MAKNAANSEIPPLSRNELANRMLHQMWAWASRLMRLGDPAYGDIVQETCIRVEKAIATGTCKQENWRPYARKAIVNRVIEEFRSRARQKVLSLHDDLEPAVVEPESNFELSDLFDRALGILTERQRAVFILRLHDCSVSDIANNLGLPESTIKSDAHAARTKLRVWMARFGYGAGPHPRKRFVTMPCRIGTPVLTVQRKVGSRI